MAVAEYCLSAIRQQLADDDMLERERVEIGVIPANDDALIADLRALQEEIKIRRGGQPIAVDDIMDEMRKERDDELSGMR